MAATDRQTFQQIRKGDLGAFRRSIAPRIDPEISSIILQMLTKNPLQRPSAHELVEQLRSSRFRQLVVDSQKRSSMRGKFVGEKSEPESREEKQLTPRANYFPELEDPVLPRVTRNCGDHSRLAQKSIMDLDLEFKNNLEQQMRLNGDRPALLFDSEQPDLFPIFTESVIGPKKPKKKKGPYPNFKNVGNILDLVNVMQTPSDPKPQSPPHWRVPSLHSPDQLFQKTLQTQALSQKKD